MSGPPVVPGDDPAAGSRLPVVPDDDVAAGSRLPVVVVGLGPVGATVALLVARAGVPVVAIERDVEVYPHPRAVALDDDALRVLQAAGIRDGEGLDVLPGGTVRIRGRGGRSLVELGPPPTTTGHPGLAFFRQPQLERVLRERLEAEPLVDLRLGTTVLGVDAPGGAGHTSGGAGHDAVLRIAGPDGTASELRAPWVLACDGGRSAIRTALGIPLRGTSSPSRWLVVDTDAVVGATDRSTAPATSTGAAGSTGTATSDPTPSTPSATSTGAPAPPPDRRGPFAPADFEFGADPHGPWVHGPLPGGAHRWEFLLPPTADRGDPEDPVAVRALLARRSPGAVPEVRRAAVYAFHARVAARWRVGRVLLLGDAAHLSPPFAGQGLCAGLRDAGNVAWKVAAAWSGTADESLLDTYARERLPHVVRTTALAVALGLIVELRRTRAARVRDAVLRRVAGTRPVRRWIAGGGWRPPSTLGGGLLARSRAHRHRAGEALPQRRVPTQGEAPSRVDVPHVERQPPLDDLLPRGWVVLGAADAGALVGHGASAVPWPTLPGTGDLRRWLAPADVALVRPDRVVFGTATTGELGALLTDAGRTAAFGSHRG
ncbi:FAD-dependent monooxygenase [Patulibacter sp.]|uniref:FAD-dependent monooxygenase n=1 Tax=Patulibacter sp. TaxID=1912859 RepID=UPI0027274AE2|nr:FAD-dependent monooxygenase [Patulibacter sp.]MDO9408358.1 FAD-dependent monooxygenase [Patulibacter sp.]